MRSSLKVAYVLQHPIQYQSPLIRYLVDRGISLNVFYGTLANAGAYQDVEFGVTVKWDSDMLGGYSYRAFDRENSSDFRRWLYDHWRADRPDAVWVHGWATGIARAAVRVANSLSIPVLLRAETSLASLRGPWYRKSLHRLYYHSYFKSISAFLAVGTLNREFYESYGVRSRKIFDVPYCVDNEHFKKLGRNADARENVRLEFQYPADAVVFLFSGKLIAKKNPELLIKAAQLASAKISTRLSVLMVGEGDRRSMLEAMASASENVQVRFAGFRNQSELPAFYAACDAFVLPSHFEPWGLVVNEALCAGCPVLLSNRIGSAPDLLREGENGFIFDSENAEQLAEGMVRVATDATWRRSASGVSKEIIENWSFRECYRGLSKALEYVATSNLI